MGPWAHDALWVVLLHTGAGQIEIAVLHSFQIQIAVLHSFQIQIAVLHSFQDVLPRQGHAAVLVEEEDDGVGWLGGKREGMEWKGRRGRRGAGTREMQQH